jgi:hypothetical protein
MQAIIESPPQEINRARLMPLMSDFDESTRKINRVLS